jgi:dipeptidyl aminopeptidase/acylaminoacyl peptidase
LDAATTTAGPVTPELLLQLLRPGDVALSPDGARIAFAVSASFREQSKPIETRLWVGSVGEALQKREAGSLPRFSPDGSRLAFASDRGHQGRLSLWVDDRTQGVRHRFVSSERCAECMKWFPPSEQRALVFADALTAPEGRAPGPIDALAHGVRHRFVEMSLANQN